MDTLLKTAHTGRTQASNISTYRAAKQMANTSNEDFCLLSRKTNSRRSKEEGYQHIHEAPHGMILMRIVSKKAINRRFPKTSGSIMTYRFLVLNGPNLGALGIRQPEIYGPQGMDIVPGLVLALLGPRSTQVHLDFFQSNNEGVLLDRMEQAHHEKQDGIVFNAGAYTHTSLALADCLAWIRVPCVEVHISNVFARESIRQQSMMARHTIGVISGFGILGYALAVQALVHHRDNIK